jgi:hypothetical protein
MNQTRDDQQIIAFLRKHVPEGATEYAPDGADEVSCLGSQFIGHFDKIAAEERRLLSETANTRFVG